MRRPSMRNRRTSGNMALSGFGNRLPQPFDSRELGVRELSMHSLLDFRGNLLQLLGRHPRPLRMQPRRAPSDPFLPVHLCRPYTG